MAEFYVNINKLQAVLPALEKISEQLENEKHCIESVKNGLSLGSGTHNIKKSLEGYIDELEANSDSIHQLKEALEDIIRAYLLTEAIVARDLGQILSVLKDKGLDYIQDGLHGISESLEEWMTYLSRKKDNVLNLIDDDKTRKDFPNDYKEVLYEVYDDVPLEYIDTRLLYDKYAEEVVVANFNSVDSKGNAAPYHLDGKLYLNTTADLNNPRGNGTTYYHEFGHFIVYKEGWIVDGEAQGEFAEFEKSLREEVSAYISSIENIKREEGENIYNLTGAQLDSYVERETLTEIKKDINGPSGEYFDVNNGLSDIIDGVSNNMYQASYGHGFEDTGESYWEYDPSRVPNEAFAQFFSAQMTGDTTEIEKMKEIMPKTYEIYMHMIESAG
jgi:hypothetical protein